VTLLLVEHDKQYHSSLVIVSDVHGVMQRTVVRAFHPG